MNVKILSCLLYDNLNDVKSKTDIIAKLFSVNKSTFYRWYSKYKTNIYNIQNIIFTNFESSLITKQIVLYVVSFFF